MKHFTSNAGQRAATILLSSATLEGHWVTVGAVDHEGGSPVFIKDGVITKGAKALTGKSIGQLKSKAGQSALGGKGTPMERVREHLKKLNESGKSDEELRRLHPGPPDTPRGGAYKGGAYPVVSRGAIGNAVSPNDGIPGYHKEPPVAPSEMSPERTAALGAAGKASNTARKSGKTTDHEAAAKAHDSAAAMAGDDTWMRVYHEGEAKHHRSEAARLKPAEPAAPKVDVSRTAAFHNRVRELRAQGHDMTRDVSRTRREFEARDPSLKREPVAAKAVAPSETPATDFHGRVKQLKAGGKSHVGAVIQAGDEMRKAKAAAKAPDLNPVEHIEAAKVAHANPDPAGLHEARESPRPFL